MTSPCPKRAGVIQCYIKRNKSGTNKLYPTYSVYMKEGDRFLMTSKRRPNNTTSNYLVSMELGDHNKNSSNYIGKVRANFVGTEFQIYDNGINYKDAGSGGEVRKELGCVLYASNVLGSRGPRKMQVCINKVSDGTGMIEWKPRQKDEEMLTLFKNKDEYGMKNLVSLINKVRCSEEGSEEGSEGGRQPSVANCHTALFDLLTLPPRRFAHRSLRGGTIRSELMCSTSTAGSQWRA